MKKIKLIVLAAGILVLAGCGNKTENSNNSQPVKENTQSQSGGIITSIKDAMASGKTMQCTYTIKGEGGNDLTTITYVNGKKYMTEADIAGNKQKSIFDGEAMYSWAEGQKQGIKMTLACTQELAKNIPQGNQTAPAPDPSGEKTFDSAMDVKCEPANGVDFSIPTDVIFQDQCEMMKNFTKNLPQGIPSGAVPMPDRNITNMPNTGVAQ